MINWFNMPVEGLSNGGQFEIKELTATENKTYEKDGEVYNKVTVNVSGGGSSDFSTAEVTIVNVDVAEELPVYLPNCVEENALGEGSPAMVFCMNAITEPGTYTYNIALYKGIALGQIAIGPTLDFAVTGDIIDRGNGQIMITGSGTVTISSGK